VVAYLYRELFARYFVPIYDYTVSDVRRLNEGTLDVALKGPSAFSVGSCLSACHSYVTAGPGWSLPATR
jgi:hypothetical protein